MQDCHTDGANSGRPSGSELLPKLNSGASVRRKRQTEIRGCSRSRRNVQPLQARDGCWQICVTRPFHGQTSNTHPREQNPTKNQVGKERPGGSFQRIGQPQSVTGRRVTRGRKSVNKTFREKSSARLLEPRGRQHGREGVRSHRVAVSRCRGDRALAASWAASWAALAAATGPAPAGTIILQRHFIYFF